MSSVGTLHTAPGSIFGNIARSVAAYAEVAVDIPEDYILYETNRTPEYNSKFVSGKFPGFEDREGFALFEGAPIARYLASLSPNSGLLGGSWKDQALVEQWTHFIETELGINSKFLFLVLTGQLTPYSKPLQQFWNDPVFKTLDVLEKHLSTRTFYVGERITLPDIFSAHIVGALVGSVVDASLRPKYINLIRHLETVANQPKIKPIFGKINYIEKAIQYTPPAKEKKEPKSAAAPAPKAEKKPKAEEADDDDEPSAPAEPKVKNPLDDLPKSSFNLEDWKRAYSNKDTRGPDGALEWFYQNYDPVGFSIWRVDFKYNQELTLTFMSSNQITGFFNRLEGSRKYLFGSMGVLGENNNSVISGVLIMRGPDVKGVVDVAPDWESYEYRKLDPQANEEDKKFFEAALAWDLELDGKKWADGKNFK